MKHTPAEYKAACERIIETIEHVATQHDNDPTNERVFGDLAEGPAAMAMTSEIIEVDANAVPIMGQVADVNGDVILKTIRWHMTHAGWVPQNKNKADALVLSRLATVVSYFIMCNAAIMYGLDDQERIVYYIGLHPDSPYCVKITLPPV